MNTYRTNEMARLTGVHPNTVRFYEEVGFITPPERLKNGYRVFTELHLKQMELTRLAMHAEVLQNGLREKAIKVIRLCAALDFDRAIQSAREYEAMLARETENAKSAITSVEAILNGNRRLDGVSLKRREAAEKLNVTSDTLRNWELNGLITVKRRENGYRVYDASDLERLNIIHTLRCASYSLTSILRLMSHLDKNEAASVETILNTPSEQEDIVSVCDQLIISLESTQKDAEEMRVLLG
ncbi:MAG: MerR family DNA-binding transcriptional regulator, partial [Oscillospiraceae bacterium]|nr:MerR family DNA-binding transcriptional regulator [Oscillospiraceae bacterium]